MGFNKHRRPTSFVGYFAQRSQLLFSPQGEATSAYDVLNKKTYNENVKAHWF